MSAFDLIIFDCDGVLVDSERIANRAFAKILEQECGLVLTLEDMFDLFVGNSEAACLQIIEQKTGKAPPRTLAERYHTEVNAALETSVEAVSGIETVLENLDIPYCVASSGSHQKMQLTLGKTGLIRFFEGKLFSTSEVERGKPAPDIYLHAASVSGNHDPQKCLVIEDSPVGVTGAVAAGMTVFGFAELMKPDRLVAAGAHRIFHEMQDLPREITEYS